MSEISEPDEFGNVSWTMPEDHPMREMMRGVPPGSALRLNTGRPMHAAEIVTVPQAEEIMQRISDGSSGPLPPMPESCYGPDSVPLKLWASRRTRLRRWLREIRRRMHEC